MKKRASLAAIAIALTLPALAHADGKRPLQPLVKTTQTAVRFLTQPIRLGGARQAQPITLTPLAPAKAGSLMTTNPKLRDAVQRIQDGHQLLTNLEIRSIAKGLASGKLPTSERPYYAQQLRTNRKGVQVDQLEERRVGGKLVGYRARVSTQAWTPAGQMSSYTHVGIGLDGKIEGPVFSPGFATPFKAATIKAAKPALDRAGIPVLTE